MFSPTPSAYRLYNRNTQSQTPSRTNLSSTSNTPSRVSVLEPSLLLQLVEDNNLDKVTSFFKLLNLNVSIILRLKSIFFQCLSDETYLRSSLLEQPSTEPTRKQKLQEEYDNSIALAVHQKMSVYVFHRMLRKMLLLDDKSASIFCQAIRGVYKDQEATKYQSEGINLTAFVVFMVLLSCNSNDNLHEALTYVLLRCSFAAASSGSEPYLNYDQFSNMICEAGKRRVIEPIDLNNSEHIHDLKKVIKKIAKSVPIQQGQDAKHINFSQFYQVYKNNVFQNETIDIGCVILFSSQTINLLFPSSTITKISSNYGCIKLTVLAPTTPFTGSSSSSNYGSFRLFSPSSNTSTNHVFGATPSTTTLHMNMNHQPSSSSFTSTPFGPSVLPSTPTPSSSNDSFSNDSSSNHSSTTIETTPSTNTNLTCCCICLDELDPQDVNVCKVLSCNHTLHVSCYTDLMNYNHNRCPLCRQVFVTPSAITPLPTTPRRHNWRIHGAITPTSPSSRRPMYHRHDHLEAQRHRSSQLLEEEPFVHQILYEDGSTAAIVSQPHSISVAFLPENTQVKHTEDVPTFKSLVTITTSNTSSNNQVSTCRPGIDMLLILDVSGSMHGLKQEQMFDCVRSIVNQLGEQDRVCILLFGSTNDLCCHFRVTSQANKPALLEQIDAVKHMNLGGTRIHDALQYGEELLSDRACKNIVTYTLLLSDGQGDDTYAYMFQQSVLYTFGLGPDHDANLLRTFAEKSLGNGGTFTYIEDVAQMQDAFSVLLQTATNITTQNIRIKIDGTNGFLTSVESGTKVTQQGSTPVYTSFLNDLQRNETFSYLCKSHLLPTDEHGDSSEQLASIHVEYDFLQSSLNEQNQPVYKIATKRTISLLGIIQRVLQVTAQPNPDTTIAIEDMMTRMNVQRETQRALHMLSSGNMQEARQVFSRVQTVLDSTPSSQVQGTYASQARAAFTHFNSASMNTNMNMNSMQAHSNAFYSSTQTSVLRTPMRHQSTPSNAARSTSSVSTSSRSSQPSSQDQP